MYIKITSRCNMTCAHCCYACNENGSDMEFSTFHLLMRKWAHIFKENNKCVMIGGGEPTMHPDFWKIVTCAMSYGNVWIATNGSRTEDALTLSRLARKGILRVALSIDRYHNPIDISVVNAFKEGLTPHEFGLWNENDPLDQREIRTVSTPYISGRCKDGVKGCPCNSIQIEPDGMIKACGCKDAPIIGTVSEGITMPEFLDGYNIFDCCYKDHLRNRKNVEVQ